MAYRTLGDLRSELLARLGMGGMGASGGANQALMDSFLRGAQHQIYWEADWRNLISYEDKTTGVGQNLYDYPTACAQDKRILRVEAKINGQFYEVYESISTDMYSTMDTQGSPARFERFDQLLIYPKADAAYTLRVWFIKDLGRFTQNNDVATIDDDLILLHATATGKAHYRQPDAAVIGKQLDDMMAKLKARQVAMNGVYTRNMKPAAEQRPRVVGRDV